MNSIFQAETQYNDFKGSVAADRLDDLSFAEHLVHLGLAQPDERVVGYRIEFNGNSSELINRGVIVYLQNGTFDNPGDRIRAVDTNLKFDEFFSYFKRFDMVMTVNGELFNGVEVD